MQLRGIAFSAATLVATASFLPSAAAASTQTITSPPPVNTLVIGDGGLLQSPNWTVSLSNVANAAATYSATIQGAVADQVIAVTTSGKLEHNIRYADGSWQGWRVVTEPAGVTVTYASISSEWNGTAQLVEVLSDGTIRHDIRYVNGAWQSQGWGNPGGSDIAQVSIATLSNGAAPFPGSAQLVAVTKTGALEHNIRYADGSWQGWRTVTPSGVKNASIAGMNDGSTQLLEVNSRGQLLHDIRYANGAWQPQGWSPLGGESVIQASITGTDIAFVSAVTSEASIEWDTRYNNGGWSGWVSPSNSAVLGPVHQTGWDWPGSISFAVTG